MLILRQDRIFEIIFLFCTVTACGILYKYNLEWQVSAVRLLIIEDNTELADLMKEKLSGFGYVCDVANDGESGDLKASDNDYDAVLLDLNLPDRDGFELLEDWRSRGITAPVLIAVSYTHLPETEKNVVVVIVLYEGKTNNVKHIAIRRKVFIQIKFKGPVYDRFMYANFYPCLQCLLNSREIQKTVFKVPPELCCGQNRSAVI